MGYTLSPWCVAVFHGERATDLLAVLDVIAGNNGEAIQQVWEYVREHWSASPESLHYVPVALPLVVEMS